MSRSKVSSQGKCNVCKKEFEKAEMKKHLLSCHWGKNSPERPGSASEEVFHLIVEGAYAPGYWMHLAAAAEARLEKLDKFLRGIWLECCDHLSAFKIEKQRYISSPEVGDKGMVLFMERLLWPGLVFYHEYDFGTTTELKLKVLGKHRVNSGDADEICLLAGNNPRNYRCSICREKAKYLCVDCGEVNLCDKCIKKHKCGEERIMPIVNSPRVGVCGYTGPGLQI